MESILKKRLPLFELQDFSWFPAQIREGITDYLQFVLKLTGIYSPMAPVIKGILDKTGETKIVDLCSGGGGAMVSLLDSLNILEKKYHLTLTDLYPNVAAFQYQQSQSDMIGFSSEPVNAMSVPENLKGMRTLFTSFHHIDDEGAKNILKDAFDKKAPIGIFEFSDRTFLTMILSMSSFFGMFLLTPLVRPFKLSRLFWTYIIPLVPLVSLWDIFASVLRTRDTNELEELISEMNSDDYEWKIGRKPTTLWFNIVYLIGVPK